MLDQSKARPYEMEFIMFVSFCEFDFFTLLADLLTLFSTLLKAGETFISGLGVNTVQYKRSIQII
jgi:hypothetical protein